MMISAPRIVFGAISSGSGKTMITCGILQALKNRKLKAASFKCGPDYIDPMFHSQVLGIKSRNLDSFFTDEGRTRYLFAKTATDMDVSVIEGVMGYYDGLGGVSTKASTYDIARIIESPTILIVNAKGMSLSLVATIKGFLEYQQDSKIYGVILNHMSAMFYETIKTKIEEELHIKVLGYVPNLEEMAIKSRYLGLVSPEEVVHFKEQIKKLAKTLEKTIDMDAILEIAKGASSLNYKEPEVPSIEGTIHISVARDEAFSFYYEDNLELLTRMGGELHFFSPLRDEKLPQGMDGLWLGGGYPELYAKELSENKSMRKSIQNAIANGIPCIAECGGFLYLHQELESEKKEKYPMVGVIKARAYKTERLQRFGYIELEAKKKSVLGEVGICFPAHEFHYYESDMPGEDFAATKPLRKKTYSCIHAKENLLAGFPHLYLYGNMNAAYGYLKFCQKHRDRKV